MQPEVALTYMFTACDEEKNADNCQCDVKITKRSCLAVVLTNS